MFTILDDFIAEIHQWIFMKFLDTIDLHSLHVIMVKLN